jgi:hypothetical protein
MILTHMTNSPATSSPIETTCDAFLGGALQVRQPKAGYRAGLDAVLLAASCCQFDAGVVRVLDCGAGVGVVGLSVARRLRNAHVTLIERWCVLIYPRGSPKFQNSQHRSKPSTPWLQIRHTQMLQLGHCLVTHRARRLMLCRWAGLKPGRGLWRRWRNQVVLQRSSTELMVSPRSSVCFNRDLARLKLSPFTRAPMKRRTEFWSKAPRAAVHRWRSCRR